MSLLDPFECAFPGSVTLALSGNCPLINQPMPRKQSHHEPDHAECRSRLLNMNFGLIGHKLSSHKSLATPRTVHVVNLVLEKFRELVKSRQSRLSVEEIGVETEGMTSKLHNRL